MKGVKDWTQIIVVAALAVVPHSGVGTPSERFNSSPPVSELFRTTDAPNSGVLAELARMQANEGLAIAWYEHDGPRIVKFDTRSVLRGRSLVGRIAGAGVFSRDGTQIALQLDRPTEEPPLSLGIMNADNSDLREFLNVARPGLMCWSYDMKHVAVVTVNKDGSTTNLKVLDLESRSVRNIASAERISSQCWSPDGKEIVFESGGNVMIQNVGAEKPRALFVGSGPTWSPDGDWIAYMDKAERSYYIIHPSGEGKKRLFHSRNGMAGLYWSPDGTIVAYVVEGGLLNAEGYRLNVRRLQDGSEDWVADGVGCCTSIQWVTNERLIAQIEGAASSK